MLATILLNSALLEATSHLQHCGLVWWLAKGKAKWPCVWQRAAQLLLYLETQASHQQQNKPEPFVLEKLNIKISNIHNAALRKRTSCVVCVDTESRTGRLLREACLRYNVLTICGVYQWGRPWTRIIAKSCPVTCSKSKQVNRPDDFPPWICLLSG